jgi:WD40 repeat protein
MIHVIFCDRKTVYIYNEENVEESDLLRTMTGAHEDDTITKLGFDHHLMLIATGSDKGRVALWDYEIGKLLGFCCGHSEDSEITAIGFCSPYPVMITCATDAKLMLWTVRPVPFANSYICLAQFDNMTFDGQLEDTSTINCISVWQGEMSGIERGYQLFHYQIPATTYRDYVTTQVLALNEQEIIKDKNGLNLGPLGLLNKRVSILE